MPGTRPGMTSHQFRALVSVVPECSSYLISILAFIAPTPIFYRNGFSVILAVIKMGERFAKRGWLA
jgi:hypothetical protein